MQKVLIIQARMGSTRLPGKVLKPVLNRPLLAYLFERIKRCTQIDKIILATSVDPSNQQLEPICKQFNIPIYFGSEEDVLSRFEEIAKKTKADVIVRVSGDCPLIDPNIVDTIVSYYINHYETWDYASNTLKRTYARGMDVEVFSSGALHQAATKAKLPHEREHVTPYIYQHPEIFNLGYIEDTQNKSDLRLTVDTDEDFQLIEKIIQELYPKNQNFTYSDILNVLKQNPSWTEINRHIKQKTL